METHKTNEGKAITIYDIAREAGVSAATVSRVLTNSSNVKSEKREKIQKLIDKYNFKPNALARGLVDTKSKTLGIMVADIRNPFYAEVFVACEEAARRSGYTVLLCNSLCDKKQEEQLLEKLEEKRVDAIIQMGGQVDDLKTNSEYVKKVRTTTRTIPMITTGKLDDTDCYQVQIDAKQSMHVIMEYLYEQGHRKIAFLGGDPEVMSTYEKITVYKEDLQKYQIPFRKEYLGNTGGYDYQTGYTRMNHIFQLEELPTAVIAINEFAAAGIMASIREHGLSIPEDISLVSYDNTYLAELTVPRLTSIDYNYRQFGENLVETAIAAIEGREVEKMQYVKTSLIIRETTCSVEKM